MSTNDQGQGSIRAKRIQGDNIVRDIQIQGGDPQQAAELLQATQGKYRGDIVAEEDIVGGNIVGSVQYIADPAQTDNLRQQVADLRKQLEQVIASQEIPDTDDAQDARKSLEAAAAELNKPQPNGERLIRKLDEANTILTKSAQAAQTAGKIGAMVIKLAPFATAAWELAQHIFH